MLQSGKTCMSLNVRQPTLGCCSTCFKGMRAKNHKSKPALETLDGGLSYFPKNFYMDENDMKLGIRACGDESESE